MMTDAASSRGLAVSAFVGLVTLAAGAAVAILVRCGPVAHIDGRWWQYAVLTLLVCLFEAKPVTVARTAGVQSVVASTTFVFAIFAMFGPGPAIIAQAIGSVSCDVISRKGPLKALFNLSQHTLSWALAG